MKSAAKYGVAPPSWQEEGLAKGRYLFEESAIRGFLAAFEALELSAEIVQEAISIRKELKQNRPDTRIPCRI